MATLESLNSLLESAGRTLDEAARQIHQVPLVPPRANVDRIAAALSAIFDLQYQIYALAPELAPFSLTHPVEKPIIALEYANRRAQEFESVGEIEMAIAFFRLFLSQGSNEVERRFATDEIERLSRTRDA